MSETTAQSVYATLSRINVNEHVEQKNGLTYLSWAWAWGIVKEHYPNATYTIYENAQGWNYHTDGKTAWVKTGVTIQDIEHIEELPVMDFRNQSIPADKVTSFDVNKAIQRSLTKAVARHGLGLYIYAGEDLPEEEVRKARATSESDLPTAIAELDACKTTEDVSKVWEKWKKIHPEYVKQGHKFFVHSNSLDVEFA